MIYFYDNNIKKAIAKMGCGALCAGSSQVKEETKQSEQSLKYLLPKITPNAFLFGEKMLSNFLKQLQLKPNNYHLIIPAKLEQKTYINGPIMEKWKAILFGLDSDLCPYKKCLGYPEPLKKKTQQKKGQGDNKMIDENDSIQWGNIKIIEHPCFHQIEKDLDRTFRFPQFQKQVFSSVLKRIANHFPALGYTQGVNFIVGFLLIIGYSSEEAFWLFVHLATNPRYLLLGLFQDGFPLSNVYMLIFKNILKRENSILYDHLYQNLQIDESMWVFKWFITFYIYSFPLQMCSFVFDFIITIGGFGLVKIAVSLVSNLQKYLLQLQEACDMSEFLDQLKNIQNFNSYLKIKNIIKFAYHVQIKAEDLKGLEDILNPDGSLSFYSEYLLQVFREGKQKNKKLQNAPKAPEQKRQNNNLFGNPPLWANEYKNTKLFTLLEKWYRLHEQNRKKFFSQNQKKQPCLKSSSEQPVKRGSFELNSKPPKSQMKGSEENSKKTEKQFRNEIKSVQNEKKSMGSQKLKTNPQEDKQSKKKSRGSSKSIKKAIPSDISSHDPQQKKDKMDIDDSLFYVPKDINLQKRKKYSQKITGNKPSLYAKDFDSKTQRGQSSRVIIAGKAILSSMSISNASNHSSISSKQTSTQKENNSGRGCNCKSKRSNIKESRVIKKVSKDRNNASETGIEEINCWQISAKEQKRREETEKIQQPDRQKAFQTTRMFKKKHKFNETKGQNIVRVTQNSEIEPKYNLHDRPGCGEESCDSVFIPNLSRYNNTKQIQSVK